MNTKDKIKQILSHNMNIGGYAFTHKQTAIACGVLCQVLLTSGAVMFIQNPIISIEWIFYGFFILYLFRIII